jgi:hypothetical protein
MKIFSSFISKLINEPNYFFFAKNSRYHHSSSFSSSLSPLSVGIPLKYFGGRQKLLSHKLKVVI